MSKTSRHREENMSFQRPPSMDKYIIFARQCSYCVKAIWRFGRLSHHYDVPRLRHLEKLLFCRESRLKAHVGRNIGAEERCLWLEK